MSDPAKRLADAERDAAAARERLSSTVATLQTKLDPKTLARSTVSDIADRGAAVAKEARSNPVLLAGIAIVAGMFFARRPIAQVARRGLGSKPGKRRHSRKEDT